jgi:hypothetical protein
MRADTQTQKSNCLLITYFFPPIKSIAVLRNAQIAQNFEPYFKNVFVVTTKNRHRLAADAQPFGNAQVFEAQTLDYRILASFRKKQAIHFSEQAKSGRIAQFLVKLNKSFPTNLLWGEGGLVYILHAFFIAFRLIRRHKIGLVYSSYMPYSDHFVAYLLKICFPSLKWVADFRDLHVEPVYKNVVFEKFQHFCNRQILKRADLVSTVSSGLARHLEAYNRPVTVLRNGIPKLETAFSVHRPPYFLVAYTGSMFGQERDPSLFLAVVQHLDAQGIIHPENFKIGYAGKDTHTWQTWVAQFGLEKYFYSEGMVSFEKSKEMQRSAHVNLLLTSATNEWSGVMTGKFYEYLAALNPIIVLINGAQDAEFEHIMSDLEAGCVVYNDRSFDVLKTFVLAKFSEWQQTAAVKPTIRTDKLHALTWPEQMKVFMKNKAFEQFLK